jgi:hypothetical protein
MREKLNLGHLYRTLREECWNGRVAMDWKNGENKIADFSSTREFNFMQSLFLPGKTCYEICTPIGIYTTDSRPVGFFSFVAEILEKNYVFIKILLNVVKL